MRTKSAHWLLWLAVAVAGAATPSMKASNSPAQNADSSASNPAAMVAALEAPPAPVAPGQPGAAVLSVGTRYGELTSAQTQVARPALVGPAPPRFAPEVEERRVPSIDFSGAQLTEALKVLEKIWPEVNFVIPATLGEWNPGLDLRLREAGLRDVLEAITIATDGQVAFQVKSPTLVAFSGTPAFGGLGGGETFGPRAHAIDPSGRPTYEITNLRQLLGIQDPKQVREALVMIQDITDETLAGLKDAELEEAGDGNATPRTIHSFQYHEGSGVLVIIGNREGIKVALDVIQSVRGHYTMMQRDGTVRITE